MDGERQVYAQIAEILEYPGPDLGARVRRCVDMVAPHDPDAADELREFLAAVEQEPLARWEERYSATFDINPVCSLYVGDQLLGDGTKRAAFMVKVKAKYREDGFALGSELPDHLTVMLRYLASLRDDAAAGLLISECLVPAVDKMRKGFGDSRNPYGRVIKALLGLFRKEEEAIQEIVGGVTDG